MYKIRRDQLCPCRADILIERIPMEGLGQTVTNTVHEGLPELNPVCIERSSLRI